MNKETVTIGGKHKTVFRLKMSKEQWKSEYSLRARIGINIGRLLQIISIEWSK